MKLILGIESSCDETAAAVFNHETKQVLSSELFSQISLHREFGGVVPEIASRSHLEKIDEIVELALTKANVTIKDIDVIGVTHQPGLAGSLLVGFSYAKGLAWSTNALFIPIDHTHGHIASAYLNADGSTDESIQFPLICMSLSGGHSSVYLAENSCSYKTIGSTIDDAAGEALDKTSKILGLGYPGGPIIEKLAREVGFEDFFKYPRTKDLKKTLNFTFSGLKTAIFYDLIERKYFDITTGKISGTITDHEKQMVASSLMVCMGDIICAKAELAFKLNPNVKQLTFVGGVACNKYLIDRLQAVCEKRGIAYKAVARKYATDNAGMIAKATSCLLSTQPYAEKYTSAEWREHMLSLDIKP